MIVLCRSRIWWRATRLSLIAMVAALLMAACNRATPTPTAIPPTVMATPTTAPQAAPSTPTFAANAPTAEASDESDSEETGNSRGVASQGAIFTSPRYSYTVVLPCCWLALPTPGTAIESALAELESENGLPIFGDLGEEMRERQSGAVLELIALLPDEENVTVPVAQMTVSVLPARGLTLEGYLEATQAELDAIANTTVLTAYIEPTLGVKAFPASVIEYTAAPNLAADDEDQEIAQQTIAGLQVAFFGHDDETLIVLTFTTATKHFDELQPEFLHIVRSVTLHDPAV